MNALKLYCRLAFGPLSSVHHTLLPDVMCFSFFFPVSNVIGDISFIIHFQNLLLAATYVEDSIHGRHSDFKVSERHLK